MYALRAQTKAHVTFFLSPFPRRQKRTAREVERDRVEPEGALLQGNLVRKGVKEAAAPADKGHGRRFRVALARKLEALLRVADERVVQDAHLSGEGKKTGQTALLSKGLGPPGAHSARPRSLPRQSPRARASAGRGGLFRRI